MKKSIALILCLVLCLSVFAGCSKQEMVTSAPKTEPPAAESSPKEEAKAEVIDPIVIKIANSFVQNHPTNVALAEVAEYISTQSNGAVKLDIYPGGALGSNSEIAQQMVAGEIDAVIAGACDNFASFNPLLYVEDLPFLFEDYDVAHAAYDGAYGDALAELIDGIGCHTMAFWENGFRQVTNSVRPVTGPADMGGLKMRAANATLFIKLFECLGCSVQMIDATELFSAMQQGMVDGQENPLSMILSSSYYEVQKYCTLTNHIYLSSPVVFNTDVWEAYPDDVKDLLNEAFAMGTENQRKLSREICDSAVAELEAKGMQVDEVADYQAWVDALAPVWDYFRSEYGAEGEALIAIATGEQ